MTVESPRAARAGVPPEILRQVKLLELRTRGLVNSLFSGEYRSVFKGQGMEFSEVREYQAGDEVRFEGFAFFAPSRVLDARAAPLSGLLGGDETIEIGPRVR